MWSSWQHITGSVVALAAVIAAVAGIVHYFRRFLSWVRKVVHFVDRWETALDLVEHELKPNNGSSTKDQISRIDDAIVVLLERLDDHDRRFDALEEIVTSPKAKRSA